jgi:protein SCO1
VCGLRTSSAVVAVAVVAFLSVAHAQGVGDGVAPSGGVPSNLMSPQLKDVGIDQKLDSQIPLDLSFRDETGQPVTLGKYFSKRPVILSLVYFKCPMLCPEVIQGMTHTLNLVKLDMGEDYDVLTVSFDPRDTPQSAAEKKQEWLKGLDKRDNPQSWHFLTGDENSIQALTRAVGFRYNWDSKTQLFAHATAIMVLTPEGKVSKYFYGAEYSPTDLRFGLIDASHDQVGSAVDQILLFCCSYNATSGQYDLIISRVLAIIGGLTIIVLGVLLLILFRAGKGKSASGQVAA